MHALYDLLSKKTRWHFEKPQRQAYAKLKESLASAPVLAHPDFSLPFILKTDASVSGNAVSAILVQEVEGEERRPDCVCKQKIE
mmetsp:Transcript_40448/g.79737  ORF Transcript_40448/g.79737 Transcript_40448/m.79737 type:complete len:84 (-) Transcript_40448:328-579(-)